MLQVGTGGTTLGLAARARAGEPMVLDSEALEAVRRSRTAVEAAVAGGRPVYGVNTGFGRLASTVVDGRSLGELQTNLLRSHACGTGPLLPAPTVRMAMLLRTASLARGRSGISEGALETLVALYNGGLPPAVPSRGSLGASGDLAPLAHMCLPLVGEGECMDGDGTIPGAMALGRLGLAPVELGPKEGLALINGTPVLTAQACCALIDALALADAADAAAAMSTEVLLGTTSAFDGELMSLRPHPGAAASAASLRAMLAGSSIVASHSGCPRVQDAYSIRCAPQVHGATRDALAYVRRVLETELASVTDNPLMTSDGSFVSAGNFHGQPVALAADHLALAAAGLGAISERRIERLLNPDLSGLPAFLARRPGLDSGLMIAQYTAASLASDNKVLAHPSSADSIPVSGAQEDHVSMGASAARKACEVVSGSAYIVATELYCAAQAYEMLGRTGRGAGCEAAYRLVRRHAGPLGEDRRFDGEIAALHGLVLRGAFSCVIGDAGGSRALDPELSCTTP